MAPRTQFVEGLPHEQLADGFCREFSELLRPELHFACRPNTCDRGIFIEVNLQNEYQLPSRFEPDDVIVDVGGHIGAFVYACLSRGAGRVITCEPEPGNLQLLRENVVRWGDRVEIIPAAVWPAGIPALNLSPAPEANTCQYASSSVRAARQCRRSTLEEMIKRAIWRITGQPWVASSAENGHFQHVAQAIRIPLAKGRRAELAAKPHI